MSSRSQFGFGSVWTSLTRTATHTSNTIGNLASGADALSMNAEQNAWLSVAQSSLDLCEDLGIKGEDGKPLTAEEAMKATRSILTTLRGY